MSKGKKYWNKRMEAHSAEKYFETQEEAFLRELDYVWEYSRFYREKFKAQGIQRGDIKGLDGLQKLPFTEKQEIRDSYTQTEMNAARGMDLAFRQRYDKRKLLFTNGASP